MSFWDYLLQVNVYLALFMTFYLLVLRNETFFRQNRLFLNASMALSFAVPFLKSDFFRDLFITEQVRSAIAVPQTFETFAVTSAEPVAQEISLGHLAVWIYATGAGFLALRLMYQLLLVRSSLPKTQGAAYSFFGHMVVDRAQTGAETIIAHEKVHMREWHSADIILCELVAIMNWISPFAWLYRSEIRHLHEFIADREAAEILQSKSDYATLLLSNTLGIEPNQLVNNFFNHSLLKRRIKMLYKTQSRRTALWKYGFVAPVFMFMLVFSAALAESDKLLPAVSEMSSKDLITEAGRGTSPMPTNIISPEKPVENSLPAAKPKEPGYTALKRHFVRQLKYPKEMREGNITGTVLAQYTVKAKRITDSKVLRSIGGGSAEEVLAAVNSFHQELEAPDGTHTFSVRFNLIGDAAPPVEIPSTNNFMGEIVVNAVKTSETTSSSAVPATNPSDTDVLPQFQGGMAAWYKYFTENVRYPVQAKEKGIQGRVVLAFIVEKDGSISDVKVAKGVDAELDAEAIRLLSSSPKWKPAMKDNEPVRVAYHLPIAFALTQNAPKQ